jgi:UDPglucose 6-dehydrogenase
LEEGAKVSAYDPLGMPGTAKILPEIEMAKDAYVLAEDCEMLVVCTEWNEFVHLDLEKIHAAMAEPNVVDGRNIYEPETMYALGFNYLGIGRGYGPDGEPVNGI